MVTPSDPTKDHYTFAGWSPAIPQTMPGRDLVVSSTWTPKEYTVRFKMNEAAIEIACTGNYGSLVAPPDIPTAENLLFAEWSMPTPIYMPDTNPLITAKWKPNPTSRAIINPTL